MDRPPFSPRDPLPVLGATQENQLLSQLLATAAGPAERPTCRKTTLFEPVCRAWTHPLHWRTQAVAAYVIGDGAIVGGRRSEQCGRAASALGWNSAGRYVGVEHADLLPVALVPLDELQVARLLLITAVHSQDTADTFTCASSMNRPLRVKTTTSEGLVCEAGV